MAYFANATEAHVIVAQQKNFTEISEMLKPYSRVLVAGCGTCVAVCLAGGEREAGILAGRLRLTRAGDAAGHIISATVERQCDREFLRLYADTLESERIEAIVSLACGAGIQFLAQMYPDIPVFPGVNTGFIGVAEDVGVWTERCRACNQCFLALTGGICPITMCAKSLLNGPCGGPQNGKCETSPERECAWVNIIERLERQNRLHLLMDHLPPRSHEPDAHPGRVVVESYKSRFGE
jgi:ferredoxin